MLIAPAGAGSLEKLGKLYEHEGDFSKRSVTPQDINNMSGFLKRDKKTKSFRGICSAGCYYYTKTCDFNGSKGSICEKQM